MLFFTGFGWLFLPVVALGAAGAGMVLGLWNKPALNMTNLEIAETFIISFAIDALVLYFLGRALNRRYRPYALPPLALFRASSSSMGGLGHTVYCVQFEYSWIIALIFHVAFALIILFAKLS